MDATQAKVLKKDTPLESDPTKISRNAPAGSYDAEGDGRLTMSTN